MMRKPAKKYFTPASATRSLMMIRRWKAQGATGEQIARWITAEYAKATDDATRRHLGLMLCSVFDSEQFAESIAKKCSRMFGLDTIRGYSISESAMVESMNIQGTENFDWLSDIDRNFAAQSLTESVMMPHGRISEFISTRDRENLHPIDPENRVYALRSIDGSLWLIGFCDCNEDILIDEECFADQPAMYFTECRHFPSPVWRLNIVAGILEFFLRHIGYPSMMLRKRVVFDGQKANLMNYEDYRSDRSWDDIDVIVAHKEGACPSAPPSYSLYVVEHPESAPLEILDIHLLVCFWAVTTILRNYDITQSAAIDDVTLNALCKKLKIF